MKNSGRLKIATIDGDTGNDGFIDMLCLYGAQSFSIWDADINQMYDSGDDFEQITANVFLDDFNSSNDRNDSLRLPIYLRVRGIFYGQFLSKRLGTPCIVYDTQNQKINSSPTGVETLDSTKCITRMCRWYWHSEASTA